MRSNCRGSSRGVPADAQPPEKHPGPGAQMEPALESLLELPGLRRRLPGSLCELLDALTYRRLLLLLLKPATDYSLTLHADCPGAPVTGC